VDGTHMGMLQEVRGRGQHSRFCCSCEGTPALLFVQGAASRPNPFCVLKCDPLFPCVPARLQAQSEVATATMPDTAALVDSSVCLLEASPSSAFYVCDLLKAHSAQSTKHRQVSCQPASVSTAWRSMLPASLFAPLCCPCCRCFALPPRASSCASALCLPLWQCFQV